MFKPTTPEDYAKLVTLGIRGRIDATFLRGDIAREFTPNHWSLLAPFRENPEQLARLIRIPAHTVSIPNVGDFVGFLVHGVRPPSAAAARSVKQSAAATAVTTYLTGRQLDGLPPSKRDGLRAARQDGYRGTRESFDAAYPSEFHGRRGRHKGR
jgi:hypothetical protein